MTANSLRPLVAVDIGNSRLKFGLFEGQPDLPLPQPARTYGLIADRSQSGAIIQSECRTKISKPSPGTAFDGLLDWLSPLRVDQADWWIGSVNRPLTTNLLDWLHDRTAAGSIRLLCSLDLPLEVAVPMPDRVGIDRLLAAVAANRLREAGRASIQVDLGSAITVDLVSPQGAFLGGAILPGIGMSARALHEFTDLLPAIDMATLAEPPPAIGTATIEAMQSGLFWGAVGGVRELIVQMTRQLREESDKHRPETMPQVFLTGGAAPSVAPLLAADACYVPNLVLAGIALTAWA